MGNPCPILVAHPMIPGLLPESGLRQMTECEKHRFYIKMGIVLDKSPGEVLDSVILYEQKNNIKKKKT